MRSYCFVAEVTFNYIVHDYQKREISKSIRSSRSILSPSLKKFQRHEKEVSQTEERNRVRQLLFLESLTIVARFGGYFSAVYSKFYNKPSTKNLVVFREIDVVNISLYLVYFYSFILRKRQPGMRPQVIILIIQKYPMRFFPRMQYIQK